VKTALARAIVHVSACLVPASLRARWREEWLGEIEGQRAEGRGQRAGQRAAGKRTAWKRPRSNWRTLRAAFGAPRDAISLRIESARQTLRTAVAGWRTDVRQVVRALSDAPSHVATVVICLGTGTSISVAVFSALNAMLFGEVPGMADRGSLVRLSLGYEIATEGMGRGRSFVPWSASDFEMLDASRGPALSGLAVEGFWPFAVSLDREAVDTRGAFVSGHYFDVLGTQPALGRLLRTEDDRPGAPAAAVIGFHLWRDRFDGVLNIVGRSILVGDRAFTVVGVAPAGFTGIQFADIGENPLERTQLWLPLHQAANWPGVPHRELPWLNAVGRLAPGATLDTARSALTAGAGRLAAANPAARRGAYVTVRSHALGFNDSPFEILQGVTLLLSLPLTVLAIGCANVANLQLARATERARELSVRFALGASRAQIVRLLTVEACVLALLSAAAGWIGAALLLRTAQPAFPLPLALDGHVLAFSVGLTAGVIGLSGLAPAWLGTRRAALEGLKSSTRAGGSAHSRLRHALVIVQMALSLALLVTSGLLLTSLRAMHDNVPPAARTTLVARLDVDTLGYSSADTRRLRDDVLARLESHPRVQSAAAERMLEFRYWSATDDISLTRFAGGGYVTASWFQTAGARLVAGRTFQPSDGGATAVVSESVARQLVPAGSAVGTLFYLNSPAITPQSRHTIVLTRPTPGQSPETSVARHPVEIIGVVADIPQRADDPPPDPAVYLPLPSDAAGMFTLRVRTNDPDAMARQVRDVVRQAEPRLPGVAVQTAEALFLRDSGEVRAVALSIGGLGVVALLLASAGLYAVMAYLVSLRRQEIGIRMAIGARPGDVIGLVFRQGVRLAVFGSLAGFAIATPIALGLRSAFVGISPFDPAAMLPPAGVLMAVTLMASAIPARRAAKIDPIRALRDE
jgi:putative ABC transport system permease protein